MSELRHSSHARSRRGRAGPALDSPGSRSVGSARPAAVRDALPPADGGDPPSFEVVAPVPTAAQTVRGDFATARDVADLAQALSRIAKRLVAARPSMRVVLMSGYGADLDAPSEGTTTFLAKPFSCVELSKIVARALAEPAAP